MLPNKKYTIIKTIEDDAPKGDINWYTISFLTPQKIDSLKYLDIRGFKVHNGYNTMEIANDDAKKIKEQIKSHDVYLSQMGKLYAWDDTTKTDSIEYGNEKLNELEKKHREQLDKLKLMKEQIGNEHKSFHMNLNSERLQNQRKRIQKKLYEKGLITRKEYEMIQQEETSVKEIKEKAIQIDHIEKEIAEFTGKDFLDENEPVALKYGCITIYSPKNIGGLKTLCFKIRGLFQTKSQLVCRIKELKSLYPYEISSTYTFEVGKWNGFSEKQYTEPEFILKGLNYVMKRYLDNLQSEEEEFNKRTSELQTKTVQEAEMVRRKNNREKRKNKKKSKEIKDSSTSTKTSNTSMTSHSSSKEVTTSTNKKIDVITGDVADEEAIKNIINYLEDPELKDKFAGDKSQMERVEVNISGM